MSFLSPSIRSLWRSLTLPSYQYLSTFTPFHSPFFPPVVIQSERFFSNQIQHKNDNSNSNNDSIITPTDSDTTNNPNSNISNTVNVIKSNNPISIPKPLNITETVLLTLYHVDNPFRSVMHSMGLIDLAPKQRRPLTLKAYNARKQRWICPKCESEYKTRQSFEVHTPSACRKKIIKKKLMNDSIESPPTDYRILEGYPRYLMSSEGKIYDKEFEKYLIPSKKPQSDKKKFYFDFSQYRNTHQFQLPSTILHRLICWAWHSPPYSIDDRRCIVKHLNGNSEDNRPENLQWSTRRPSDSPPHRICPKCNKSFTTQTNFKRHITRETECNPNYKPPTTPIEYKTIPGYSNYCFTPDGRIYSMKGKRYLPQVKTDKGMIVHESKKLPSIYVHRLMCLAYHPQSKVNFTVQHLDGNKFNNSADNIRWSTTKVRTAENVGSHKRSMSVEVIDPSTNQIVKQFPSINSVCKEFNCLHGKITKAIKTGSVVSGFIFKHSNKKQQEQTQTEKVTMEKRKMESVQQQK